MFSTSPQAQQAAESLAIKTARKDYGSRCMVKTPCDSNCTEYQTPSDAAPQIEENMRPQ